MRDHLTSISPGLYDYQGRWSAIKQESLQRRNGPLWRAIKALLARNEASHGRTHQLRVHCAHPEGLGLPMVGDELYGVIGERLHLHAHKLEFQHPTTKELITITAPIPF